ncbi:carboxylesterase/lipase family protein [Silvibacterium acidisoli]|uniref:carboxylesterase/lipase family protein n=1 Tax=Acidobacteriaceae bacterium ZG23-2 TaxID=2883246 RepID=UPI00406C089A
MILRSLKFLPLAFSLAVPLAHAADQLQIKTDKGKVEGTYTDDHKVRAFKGIPYAAPPVGDLRWQPPQPAAKWNDTFQAKEFGHHCIQTGSFDDMAFKDAGESEDCLNLNVWAPADAKKGSLPVMVWIYGGGFQGGGASEPRQDGQFLAHKNVVVVSMNYRLGVMGFFVHPELTAESKHHASGNYGLMDEAAALAWVKKNISAFGGDPKNITIFGESAGSFAVSTLMASPLSKDLMQKAIGESGGAFNSASLAYEAREEREQDTIKWAQKNFNTTKLADLRKLSPADLVKAANSHLDGGELRFSPDVDGWFLPDSVPNIFAAGKQAHIPVLAGWNKDEVRSGLLRMKPAITADSYQTKEEAEFGSNAKKFFELYPGKTDEEAQQSAGDYADDRFIAYSTWRWLEAQVKTGNSPVYRYSFDLPAPDDHFHGVNPLAFHSDDIEYVFGTLDSRVGAKMRPEDYALSQQIQGYWTNFARTGDPNGEGLPKWPTYNAGGNWMVMHLDKTSEARPDTQRDRYLFLDSVWSTPKQ